MALHTKSHDRPSLFVSVCLLVLALSPLAPARAAQAFHPTLVDPLTEPWRWRTFPELSGLGVKCLTEDPNGTMWFGAAEGIRSYDGMRWTAYGKSNGVPGQVETLCVGADNILYAGGIGGIAGLTNKDFNRIWPLALEGFPLPKHLAAVKLVVTGHGGTLWAATSWGLPRHQGSEWVLHTGREGAAMMKENSTYPPVRVEFFPDEVLVATAIPKALTNRFDFSEAQEDLQGRVWLGTWFGEILSHQPAPPFADSAHIPAGLGGQWTVYGYMNGLGLQRWTRTEGATFTLEFPVGHPKKPNSLRALSLSSKSSLCVGS